ncbi:HD domain-containing protein [Methylobacterium sp.]|uniref:HD domain-containing protein n=1 Tax=Methylobacterium sp. TaxID=409 RepID=UPI0026381B87|nr:HD domain-containing protein [Methylobacterium sp.]MDB5644940.1 5-nucleotidase [Methylobacterium sp.]
MTSLDPDRPSHERPEPKAPAPSGRDTDETRAAAREAAAADIVFGALPPDLGQRLRALWEEFEAGTTAEARFAMACDRMQGFLQNVLSDGLAWREHGITRAATAPRMGPAMAVDPVFATLIGRLYGRAEGMLG